MSFATLYMWVRARENLLTPEDAAGTSLFHVFAQEMQAAAGPNWRDCPREAPRGLCARWAEAYCLLEEETWKPAHERRNVQQILSECE